MVRKALVAGSVLLLTVTVALWLRSYWVVDQVAYRGRSGAHVVLCFRGTVFYGKFGWPGARVYAAGVNFGFGPGKSKSSGLSSRLAFRLGQPQVDWCSSLPVPPGAVMFSFAPRWRVEYEFLAVLFGISPLWTLVRWVSVPLLRRHRGLCLACGYSLTGNESGVCPECGTAVENLT